MDEKATGEVKCVDLHVQSSVCWTRLYMLGVSLLPVPTNGICEAFWAGFCDLAPRAPKIQKGCQDHCVKDREGAGL